MVTFDPKPALSWAKLGRYMDNSRVADGNRWLLAVIQPDPAVLGVGRRGIFLVLLFEQRKFVGLDRFAGRFDVDAEQFGRVQAEDLVLDGVGQVGVLVLLHQLGWHLEFA